MCPHPPVFRYTSRQNALRLTVEGNLRLNPPSVFHDEARFGLEIGDSREAARTLTVTDTPVTSDADLPRELRNFAPFPKPDDPFPITLVITEAVLDANPVDALIYCVLRRKALQCVVGFEGDTWVIIEHPCDFLAAINRVLPADLECRGFNPCTYASREINQRDPIAKIHPLLVKDARHAHQEELRAVWTSRSHQRITKSLDVTSTDIAKFCHITDDVA